MKQEAIQSIKNNDLPALQAALEKSPSTLHSTDHRGDSLLHIAAQYADINLLSFLKERGIDVNVGRVAEEVYTPLHAACRYGRIDAVRWLIENGAMLEAGNGRCATPLIAAAMGGCVGVIRLLLEAGASPAASYFIGDGDSRREMDAISIARIKGNEEIVNYLETLA